MLFTIYVLACAMECCSRRTCRWNINHVQNQHGLALLANFSLKSQTEWLISKVYSYFPCGLTFLALSSWASTVGILENYHCWRFHGSGVIAVLQIIGLILFCTGMHHEYFWGRQCAFVFPIYVRKYRKYTIDRWIVVYTVCASAVISPLRQ